MKSIMLLILLTSSLLMASQRFPFRHVLRRAIPSGICSRVYSRRVT